ncbi:hypothetical protein GCM10010254_23140 [Streptomyces chromofuscus]|nr:hypothetical protein GCM10010254_23140 [Streptomyces chromofuscus]
MTLTPNGGETQDPDVALPVAAARRGGPGPGAAALRRGVGDRAGVPGETADGGRADAVDAMYEARLIIGTDGAAVRRTGVCAGDVRLLPAELPPLRRNPGIPTLTAARRLDRFVRERRSRGRSDSGDAQRGVRRGLGEHRHRPLGV